MTWRAISDRPYLSVLTGRRAHEQGARPSPFLWRRHRSQAAGDLDARVATLVEAAAACWRAAPAMVRWQVEPMKSKLKAPGTKRLKLKYDNLLSRFAFNFNLRHYTMVDRGDVVTAGPGIYCSPRHPTHFQPSFLESNGTQGLGLPRAWHVLLATSSNALSTLVS